MFPEIHRYSICVHLTGGLLSVKLQYSNVTILPNLRSVVAKLIVRMAKNGKVAKKRELLIHILISTDIERINTFQTIRMSYSSLTYTEYYCTL